MIEETKFTFWEVCLGMFIAVYTCITYSWKVKTSIIYGYCLFCFFFMLSDVINQYCFVCATITEHIIVKNPQFNVHYGEMSWPSQRMWVNVLKCISRAFRENQKTNFFCSWEAFDISMEESGKWQLAHTKKKPLVWQSTTLDLS